MKRGESLAIALHPTDEAIRLVAEANVPLSVCPASGLPAGTIRECSPLTASSGTQSATLRLGGHVAFSVQASADGTLSRLDINYTAEDAFLLLKPPGAWDGIAVQFTPGFTTVGAIAYTSQFRPVEGLTIRLEQLGTAITTTGPCAFPSELPTCFTNVTPGEPAFVAVNGTASLSDGVFLDLDFGR